MDEAKDMAKKALSLHIHGVIEDGQKLPAPSKLEEMMTNPDLSDAAAYLLVDVPYEASIYPG